MSDLENTSSFTDTMQHDTLIDNKEQLLNSDLNIADCNETTDFTKTQLIEDIAAQKLATETMESNDVEIEELDGGEGDVKKSQLTAEMMKNPEVLAALQSKFGSISGTPSGYIENLPKAVKRRIKALKKLQLEYTKHEAKFYEEVHSLECKYAKIYAPLFEKRSQITSAAVEPTDDECDFPSDTEKDEDDLCDDMKKKTALEDKADEINEGKDENENINGIPEFWLTIFKNVEMLAEMIQVHDEPILKHLTDVKVKFSESNPMGFTLEFFFEPNEYFTNSVLTKEYEMKCIPDETDPFSFEGPEIYKCKGCTIDWKKGKNVTVKTIKKKQKHKSRGSVRTVTKTVQNDSFFNFFNPPTVPEDEELLDDETQTLLAVDFEIGHFIRERIVPRAVLFFTGEALTEDDYDDEDDDDDDDEGEANDQDDDDDENDPDFNPQAVKSGKKSQQQPPPECKQQ
ncbi:nucleosome assembly protein 1-like 1-B isoform X2 [Centruroides vittatus]|uniref:nucleosome assembly protein 1-like 1-B isoform X2 n=1 Tax=Centruroides vittatus TaxID=120091 RepID=UPI0035104219